LNYASNVFRRSVSDYVVLTSPSRYH